VKLSVSLPETDVDFVDRYAKRAALPSRSAALHQAIEQLRDDVLREEYREAFQEWQDSGEAAAWEAVVGDGLGNDEAR